MINIIFKNVDQGDSIIIEWEDEKNDNKIGIIDCNLKQDKSNPVLEYLIAKNISEIEFIILSHPHTDHFSGLNQLLDHIVRNQVKAKNFLHTCYHVEAYIKSALKSIESKKNLFNIFSLVKKLRDSNGLNDGFASDSPFFAIPIVNDVNLTVLSPSSKETAKYAKNIPFFSTEEEAHNPPNANWLSTLLKIGNDKWYILLTSDCEKFSLIRVDKKSDSILKGKLVLAQAPHHGSLKNHNNTFWKKRARNARTPIVFSVGKNNYSHPNQDVVNFFHEENYEVHSTNNINGVELASKSESIELLSNHLNVISMLITPNEGKSKLQGDQSFTIEQTGSIKSHSS